MSLGVALLVLIVFLPQGVWSLAGRLRGPSFLTRRDCARASALSPPPPR
jgi:hypothetical protein